MLGSGRLRRSSREVRCERSPVTMRIAMGAVDGEHEGRCVYHFWDAELRSSFR